MHFFFALFMRLFLCSISSSISPCNYTLYRHRQHWG